MAKMNSGVLHEILQALNNLGGQAVSKDIIDEIERIRSVYLSERERSNLRIYLNIYSAKAKSVDGKKYFHRVGPGVWALNNKGQPEVIQAQTPRASPKIQTTLTESFETITNTLRTIKEYRDYYDSSSPSWPEYINEIFHILGFSTQQKDSRTFLLSDIGEYNSPKAIVMYNLPNENFEEILPGLTWESYLLFAADYHQLEWGILTNGLRIKVINLRNYKSSKPFFEANLEEIITNEKSDSFFALYKVFSRIKNESDLPLVSIRAEKIKHGSSDVPKTLSNILEVCKEMSRNNGNFRQAYLSVSKKSHWSAVPDACTRRIGLNTEGFLELYANKDRLIEHLNSYYPKHLEEIERAFSESN